MSLVSQIT